MKNENTIAPAPLRWRIRNWLFRELFPVEYTRYNDVVRDRDWWRELANKATAMGQPAKMTVDGGMPPNAIEETLRGTAASPVVKAVFAHITARIVQLSDRATDAPRETLQMPDRVIQGYSADERLHDAGGASYLAELLSRLQQMTQASDERTEEAA